MYQVQFFENHTWTGHRNTEKSHTDRSRYDVLEMSFTVNEFILSGSVKILSLSDILSVKRISFFSDKGQERVGGREVYLQ